MRKNDKLKIWLAVSFCLLFHFALDLVNIYRIHNLEKEQINQNRNYNKILELEKQQEYQEQIFFSKISIENDDEKFIKRK